MPDPTEPPLPYIDEHGVLHDPVALAVIRAVERHNCRNILMELHHELMDLLGVPAAKRDRRRTSERHDRDHVAGDLGIGVEPQTLAGQVLIHAEVRRFAGRLVERGLSAADALIVVLNVDDARGAELAAVLMPGHDWESIRAQGMTPYARGLAARGGIQDLLDHTDPEAGKELRAVAGVAIVMLDRGVTAVFGLADVGL